MKIRGVQITGTQILSRFFGADLSKEIAYVKGFKKMTVDTDDGNWIITKDEIISFIEERRKEK